MLEKSVGEESRGEVLYRSVVDKCCVVKCWREIL